MNAVFCDRIQIRKGYNHYSFSEAGPRQTSMTYTFCKKKKLVKIQLSIFTKSFDNKMQL